MKTSKRPPLILEIPNAGQAHIDSDAAATQASADPPAPDIIRLYDAPGHIIRRLHKQLDALYEAQTSEADLTVAQFAILWTVSLAPDREQLEIAKLATFDQATTGGIIGRLQSKGLVERRRSVRSKRGFTVHLTEQGRAVLDQTINAADRVPAQIFVGLTPDEQQTLLYLISKAVGLKNSYYTPLEETNG